MIAISLERVQQICKGNWSVFIDYLAYCRNFLALKMKSAAGDHFFDYLQQNKRSIEDQLIIMIQ